MTLSRDNLPSGRGPGRFFHRFSRLLLLVMAVGLACGVDAFWIEPNWIVVTHHRVSAPVDAPLKIAHLSDLHTLGIGRREAKLLAILDREQPDLIVITGDILASHGTYDQAAQLLSRLRAPLGVWLVRGNWENWYPLRHEQEFYRRAGVNFLLNSHAEVRPDIWLVGLDDPWSGRPDLPMAMAGIPPDAYTIVLFHSPVFFDRSAGRYQLALAGHSHGGQVRVPFLPPLWTPGGIGPYVEGWFEKNGSRMYVSRGIGMTLLPIRFNCRPEVAFITLVPQ